MRGKQLSRLAPVVSAAASLVITQLAVAQVSLTNTSYTQNFSGLASVGASSSVPAGWSFVESGTGGNATYTAGTGTNNAGNTYSFGAADGDSDRAFGGLQSGTVLPTIGAGFTYGSPGTLTSFTLAYTGEQWRLGATGRTDRLDFQYSTDATSISSGNWTDADGLDFTAPVTAGTVGALVGNNSPNKAAVNGTVTGLSLTGGATFYIRWNDFNATNSDDGLAIDDLTFTFTTAERFWNTTSGTWNTTTPNWRNGSTGGVNYVNNDKVYFGQTTGDSVVTIPANVSPQSITVDASQNYTFTGAGAIVTGAGLTKAGSGQLILENDNQISGDSNITGGLRLGSGGTTGSLGSGNISMNQGILTFFRSNALAINGNLTGTGSVFQSGTGSTTLAGANSYNGTTVISAGKLIVNGTHTGGATYSVGASASLGGAGQITLANNLFVNIAGNVSPGTADNTTGKLTLNTSGTGVTQLAPGGSYSWEINSQTGTAGVAWDLLDLDAVSVTAQDVNGQRFTIKIVSLNGANAPGPTPGWQPGSPENPKRFTIATSSTNGFAGVDLNKFAIDTSQFQDAYPLDGWSLAIGNSGGSLDLVYVPEPSGIALLGAASAMFGRRRRK